MILPRESRPRPQIRNPKSEIRNRHDLPHPARFERREDLVRAEPRPGRKRHEIARETLSRKAAQSRRLLERRVFPQPPGENRFRGKQRDPGTLRLVWSIKIDYNSPMKRASVSELKTSLSAYLRGVKNGEEVLVTERGRPVARLVPAIGVEGVSDRKKRLVRAGLLRPGSKKLSPKLLKPSPVLDAEGKVLRGLLEERRSGR